MENSVLVKEAYLKPGHVFLPATPSRLGSVIASGVAVTMFDAKRKCGGMAHYLRPNRLEGLSTPIFAAPAIVALARMFFSGGSKETDLEVQVFGGAINPEAGNFAEGQSQKNVEIGLEIIEKLGLRIIGQDTGGHQARKVVFDSGTGEVVVAKVNRVRDSDWYPEITSIEDSSRR